MCGFLTEFTFNGYTTTATTNFESLLMLSVRRGPDATQVFKEENYQLGFNRLAILDLSINGNQPKQSPSKRYHVVFNGEIYNYKVLEKDYGLLGLESTSDTEVLLHLLDKVGVATTVTLLNGMFAICIIDTQLQELYMVRDFAGIKPLFYGIAKEGIVAASQFNQVFKHEWFREALQLRADVMKEYFGFGYMQAPNTIYKTIFQVNPGTYIKVSSQGQMESVIYKKFSKENQPQFKETKRQTAMDVEDALIKAIKKQLISDVPLATFLSGGIDSPLVAAIAKQSKPDIKAYTIAVDDERFNERNEAVAYAKHADIEQVIFSMESSETPAHIDKLFEGFSEPFGDPSSIPTYWITKMAKQENTVMLSGDGGDELFWGYPRMFDIISKRFWFLVPFVMRKPIVRLANKLGWMNSWAPYNYKYLKDFITAKHLHIFKSDLDAFFPETSFSKDLENLYQFDNRISRPKLLHELRYNELNAHLQRVLIKVDRMSMAHSLEVRVPFLDKECMDLAWAIEPDLGATHNELKYILKKVMRHYYPENLIYNKKKGFSIALDTLLRGALKEDVKKVVFDSDFYGEKYLNIASIKEYIKGFYENNHHAAWGVWHIYAWQKWALKEQLI